MHYVLTNTKHKKYPDIYSKDKEYLENMMQTGDVIIELVEKSEEQHVRMMKKALEYYELKDTRYGILDSRARDCLKKLKEKG